MDSVKNQAQENPAPLTGQAFPPPGTAYVRFDSPVVKEISLMDLCRVLWRRRWIIIGVTGASALLALAVVLWLPNIYRASVLMTPIGAEEGKGGLSSVIGNLGGIASLAGLSLPSSGSLAENLAVLKSREFLNKFVTDRKLMPVLFAEEWDAGKQAWKNSDPKEQPGPWDAYRKLSEDILRVSVDKKSSLVTVAVEWTDPQLSSDWANALVARLNNYLRQDAIARSDKNLHYLNEALGQTAVSEMRQTLFTLIAEEQKKAMLANTQEEFAFRVLDRAAVPDRKAKPKRASIILLTTIFSGILVVFGVLFGEWILTENKRTRDQSEE